MTHCGGALSTGKDSHNFFRPMGRPNCKFVTDYTGEENLSQKCGGLRCIEIIIGLIKLKISWISLYI